MRIVASAVFVPVIVSLPLSVWPMASLAQQKAPVPDAQAEQTAKTSAGELFGSRFRQAKTTADKTALATEMIEAAGKLQDGTPGQYVLLKIAADIAAGAGDAPVALQAVEKLVERFDVAGPKLTAETLLTAARSATVTNQYKAIGEAALKVVDGVAEADEYELALSLCELARSSAQKTRQYALTKELAAKMDDLKQRQTAFQEYRAAWGVLDKNPTEPAANLAAGRYLCFVKGDWDRGVPMLALGSDAKLKDVAVKDLRGANSAEEQAAIGDAWWELAETQQGSERDLLRLRAGFWYQQAEPKLAGELAGLKIKQRLEELKKAGREIPTATDHRTVTQGPAPAIAPFDETKAKRLQLLWSKHLKVPVVQTNSLGMKLALIPPGEFDMGSTEEQVAWFVADGRTKSLPDQNLYIQQLPAEAPKHHVRITRPFYLGLCEVTQAQYESVMGINPSKFKGCPNRPAERMTWDQASAFCRKLGELPGEQSAGAVYRLPTEAEWEYACRAGTTTSWYGADYEAAVMQQAWIRANAGQTTNPVGQKAPNAWGLYDMHGNVFEWCQDLWDDRYYATSPSDDPTGAQGGSERVIRGGCWYYGAGQCRSAYRGGLGQGSDRDAQGFRVVRNVSGE